MHQLILQIKPQARTNQNRERTFEFSIHAALFLLMKFTTKNEVFFFFILTRPFLMTFYRPSSLITEFTQILLLVENGLLSVSFSRIPHHYPVIFGLWDLCKTKNTLQDVALFLLYLKPPWQFKKCIPPLDVSYCISLVDIFLTLY